MCQSLPRQRGNCPPRGGRPHRRLGDDSVRQRWSTHSWCHIWECPRSRAYIGVATIGVLFATARSAACLSRVSVPLSGRTSGQPSPRCSFLRLLSLGSPRLSQRSIRSDPAVFAIEKPSQAIRIFEVLPKTGKRKTKKFWCKKARCVTWSRGCAIFAPGLDNSHIQPNPWLKL